MKLVRYSQFGFPFHPSARPFGNPAMHRLRIAGRKQRFAHLSAPKRLVAQSMAVLLWPFGALRTALTNARQHKGGLARVPDAWWLAMTGNVPPLEYFSYRLWEAEPRARRDEFIFWHENSQMLAALNARAGWRRGPDPVTDKERFAAHCTAHDLPQPRLFGTWRAGEAVDAATLPQTDIFLKPPAAKSAIGVERWLWSAGAYTRDGESLTPEAMAEHIARHAKTNGATMVQEAVRPHADQAPHIGASPACARIITGRRRDGRIVVIDAMVSWPAKGRVVVQGGDYCMVDKDTGKMGKTVVMGRREPSGTALEGTFAPNWDATLDAVKRGHAALSTYVFLGWDVALGADGPALLETNGGWGAIFFQQQRDLPLGATEFADITAEYLG